MGYDENDFLSQLVWFCCRLFSPFVIFFVNPGVAVRSLPLSDHISPSPLVIKHGKGEKSSNHRGVWRDDHTCEIIIWRSPVPCWILVDVYGLIFEKPYSWSSSPPRYVKQHTLYPIYPLMFADTIRSHPDNNSASNSTSAQPAPGKYFGFLCSASAFSGILHCKEVERISVWCFVQDQEHLPPLMRAAGGFF